MPHNYGERPSRLGSEEVPFQSRGVPLKATSAMARETAEAPDVVARLLADRSVWRPIVVAIERRKPTIAVVCGRGSSGHVGVFLRYLIETRLGIPVSATAPSIITNFKRTLALRGALFIVVSQSGRSPDLIAATADARSSGALTVALINDAEFACRARRRIHFAYRCRARSLHRRHQKRHCLHGCRGPAHCRTRQRRKSGKRRRAFARANSQERWLSTGADVSTISQGPARSLSPPEASAWRRHAKLL